MVDEYMWGFIFRLNEIFRIAYAYACIYAIGCKAHEGRFRVLVLGNNNW